MAVVSMQNLKPGAHIHLMGICGTAMASLAGLLKDKGYKVTGSDQNVYPPMSTQLRDLGISIMEGYKPENLTPRPDFVIVGNVITKINPESQALQASDIPYTSLPKAMGEFVIADRHSIVVTGTHGKTTTTSLAAWVAWQLGLQPGFMIGGIPKNFAKSYEVPKGNFFVIEGDEYDTAFFDKVPKFTHYRPRTAILTSIEFDHADIYKDLDHVMKAFESLLDLIPQNGLLVANAEDANIKKLLALKKRPYKIVTYGLQTGDYRAQNIQMQDRMRFLAQGGGKSLSLELQIFGDYNVRNALAVFAVACELGWDLEKTRAAMNEFQGVKRRQEIIGRPNNITIIEDFAHHPTAVRETIEIVQSRFPKGRVFSVFEPRSATSRRSVFQKEYYEAFKNAQYVVFPPPFNQDNIPQAERFSSAQLASDLERSGVTYFQARDVDGIVDHLASLAKPGDVILLMSNGGFGGIYEKLNKTLA